MGSFGEESDQGFGRLIHPVGFVAKTPPIVRQELSCCQRLS
jgi:hypothetical protein